MGKSQKVSREDRLKVSPPSRKKKLTNGHFDYYMDQLHQFSSFRRYIDDRSKKVKLQHIPYQQLRKGFKTNPDFQLMMDEIGIERFSEARWKQLMYQVDGLRNFAEMGEAIAEANMDES